MRLGLFGGTFDPPHLGHLIVAQDAYHRLQLDRLLFVPAALPPHKQSRSTSTAEVRMAMLRAAAGDDARFEVSDIELRRDGASYSVDTLRELTALYPEAELMLLIGADQFREFATWREPDEIARLARLVVLSRGDVDLTGSDWNGPHRRLTVTRIDISSTEIRRRVAAGEPFRYLMPEAVEELIERHGLYRAHAAASSTKH